MPNPRLTVRIPPDLDELLPDDGAERSRVTIEALRAYLQPSDPENKISQHAKRISDLEQLIAILQKDLRKLQQTPE